MLLSSLVPRAGVSASSAIEVLREQAMALGNLTGFTADERLAAYHSWAPQASQALGYVFSTEQVDTLVATHRHDALVARATGYNQALVNHMISAEQTDRGRVFADAIAALEGLERHCSEMPKAVLVADTNVYLHHEQYFDQIDWQRVAGTPDAVRLLVPSAVVRELDQNKRSPGNKRVSESNPELVRTRARVTSRRLRELFESPHAVVPIGEHVQVELLLDPVGHVRLDDTDSEILDRAVAARTISGRRISVVTGDGGMQFSAKIVGLDVIQVED